MREYRSYMGIGMMTLAMAFLVTKDGAAKALVRDLHPAQVIWFQFLFNFIIILLVTVPKHGLRALRPTPFRWQLMRGLCSIGGVICIYWALRYIPLVETQVMALLAPILVTVLSPLILGETFGIRRALAVLVGFVGVLIILRPGFGGDLIGYLIGLLSGLFFAFFFIGSRKLAGRHPPLVAIAHNVIFGVVLLGLVMPLVWVDVPPHQYLNLGAFVTIALVGQGLLVSAFIFAPASIIAPYQYTAIPFGTLIGYYVFAEFPDLFTWIGIALITVSGIYIALRESQVVPSEKDGGTRAG